MPRVLPIELRATPRHFLGMPPARFLRDYWQRRPLLIRSAFPGFRPPLTPDELAGLACMDGALARIVAHAPRRDRWTLRSGPFDDATFAQLPPSHWTLLVQDADKWDAATAALLERFTFIPDWRIDDVMISYATDQGGVGAHVDQYDVFLVQGLGRRRWSIDARPHPPTAFRDDVELKLLRRFTPSHTWELEPGDILYLPPGVPHDGVALGECMTYSVGMRAPTVAEMLVDLVHGAAAALPETQRYGDAGMPPARRAGEIDAAAFARVRHSMGALGALLDDDAFADWFGCFITRYRLAQTPVPRRRPPGPDTLAARLARSVVVRDAWTRMAWRARGRAAVVYASGAAFPAPAAWAAALAGSARRVDGKALLRLPQRRDGLRLLAALIAAGHCRLQVH